MIICGHALIGKSTASKKIDRAVDLESSIFCRDKNFEAYVDMIESLHKQNKIVLTSCHNQIRKILQKRKIDYELIYPDPGEKKRYLSLSDLRQPHPLKTEVVEKFWDIWHIPMQGETPIILPAGMHLTEFLTFKETNQWTENQDKKYLIS